MKILNYILATFLLVVLSFAFFWMNSFARSSRSSSSDVYVQGYTKSNWTYVAPYYRSSPDGIISNNYWYIDSWIWWGGTSNYSTTPAYNGYSNSIYYDDSMIIWTDSYIAKKQSSCSKKYPGTTYQIQGDKCSCNNWGEYDSKSRSCITEDTRNSQCNTKFPWTTYQADGDKCVCKNGGEYDSKKKSCIDTLADKCKYSGWEKARVWDVSTQWMVCWINWSWACKAGTEWDSNLSKCISTWDKVCKSVYGDKSVWTKKVENKKYICWCVSGYDMVGDKCTSLQ